MRNLHETSTQRARYLYPDSKNNSRLITYGIGCVWEMPSLAPLSSLVRNDYLRQKKGEKALYFSVNAFSTQLLNKDTIFYVSY